VRRVIRALIFVLLSVSWLRPVGAATPPAAGIVSQAASSTTGAIQGTVRDEGGGPIAGVTVTIRGANTYVATTDAQGAFSIDDVVPGVYVFTAQKAGYNSASQADFAVLSGEVERVPVVMHAATFSSLRTIATVRASAGGAFNTSTASVDVVNSQTFMNQAAPQVDRVLNQIPGVQISLPSDDANGASLGAVTFPNIRGALSYETQTLIDGHPLATASFGDYVSTYLNSFTLGSVEVIKGPGAMAPNVNSAIGGTVNFRTKDPTLTPTPDYTFGYTSTGGTFYNFGFSDTIGRLGFVIDLAGYNDPSVLNNTRIWYDPTSEGDDGAVGNIPAGQGYALTAVPQTQSFIPGTASYVYNHYPLIACCYTVSGYYNNTAELMKLRYQFSNATTATVAYLGSQTTADENGDNSSLTPSLFTPGASYTGTALAPNFPVLISNVFASGQPVLTNNNEPIIEGEVRTTLGNDTILARYYHAGIVRLVLQGQEPNIPTVLTENLYGVGYNGSGQIVTYNGTPTPVYYFDYFQENETDKLNGYSFEWDHPIGSNNNLSLSWDSSTDSSISYEIESNTLFDSTFPNIDLTAAPYYASTDLPEGSAQTITVIRARDTAQFGKLGAVLSLYSNQYANTYTFANPQCAAASGTAACAYNSPDWQFNTFHSAHFDQRLGLTYQFNPNTILRLAAGSAIAPPYLYILSQNATAGNVSVNTTTNTATVQLNNGTLLPETAAGIDLGADVRIPKPSIYVSADAYQTNLFNHFIETYQLIGTCGSNSAGLSCGKEGTSTTPLYSEQWFNLNNSRFQGVELSIKRIVDTGLNFSVSGAIQHAYAYDLPKCFYGLNTATGQCGYFLNLGIIPGQNFTANAGSPVSGYGYTSFSNQNIPYFQGNAEVSYHWGSGIYAALGATLYGKNNSFNEAPFSIAYATIRVPLSDTLSFQVSGDNIFNSLNSLYPILGGGVNAPLAASPVFNGVTLPAVAATNGNVLGPAVYRFVLTKTFGKIYTGSGANPNSSQPQ
jgi:hypothetical protein